MSANQARFSVATTARVLGVSPERPASSTTWLSSSTCSAGGSPGWAMAVAQLECELLDRTRFATHAAARAAVFEFVEGWYNTRRRHSALGYVSPLEFERLHADPVVGARRGAHGSVRIRIACADWHRHRLSAGNTRGTRWPTGARLAFGFARWMTRRVRLVEDPNAGLPGSGSGQGKTGPCNVSLPGAVDLPGLWTPDPRRAAPGGSRAGRPTGRLVRAALRAANRLLPRAAGVVSRKYTL